MILTADIFKKITPKGNAAILKEISAYLPLALEKYNINTPIRVGHFLAQAAHESDSFKTLREYWGPTAAQKRYEGRKDLGNTVTGDGSKYRGRGIFQITGRANYTTLGKKLGYDLVNNPELAATGEVSVLTACEFWSSRGLNDLADKDDIKAITKKINGGYNGLDDRIAYHEKIKPILPNIFALPTVPLSPPPPKQSSTTPTNTTPHVEDLMPLAIIKRGDKSTAVSVVQISLAHNWGYVNLKNDGDYGPATEAAIRDFQKKNGYISNSYLTVPVYNAIMHNPNDKVA